MSMTLPLIDLILAHGWVPLSMLSTSEHDKTFARLSASISKYKNLSLEEMNRGIAETVKGYGEYVPTSQSAFNAVGSTLLSAFDDTYSKTKTVSDVCHLELTYALGHSYADRFYILAVEADVRHCLLWLIDQERLLRSDDDMKQVVRETLSVITGYCRMTHSSSEINKPVFGFVLRKLTALYFEIVYTYLEEHRDWREYIESLYSDLLPLTFFEFTSIYWETMPTEEDEASWESFEQTERTPVIAKRPVTMVPTGAEAEENEVVTKYDHFVEVVQTYKFFECPAVACLNETQRGKLVRSIVNHKDNYGAYAIAMLCELEYDKWMEENFVKANPYSKRGITKTMIIAHWKDALSLNNDRAVAGNYNVLRNPSSKEDRTVYKASEYTMKVHQDYIAIREYLNSAAL